MRKWLPLGLIAGAVIFSVVVYGQLPERLVTHWNARGEPDGYSSRAIAAFMLPATTLAIWGILLVVPYIDPRRANIEKFRDTYESLMLAIVFVLAIIHVAILGAAIGWPISVARITPLAVGVLFIVLGNLFPRFRSNFFMGIRTPWTLSSETVWTKTHRVGGYLMVATGVIIMLSALITSRAYTWVIGASVLSSAVAMIAYSYVAWRQETRES